MAGDDGEFPVRLPDVPGTPETTQGKTYATLKDRWEAFNALWRAASQALDDAIEAKDAGGIATAFSRIDALIADRDGQTATFCFSVLIEGKSLMAAAERHRSRLLLDKAQFYLRYSDKLGMGDMSHRALNDEMSRSLQRLAALPVDDWR